MAEPFTTIRDRVRRLLARRGREPGDDTADASAGAEGDAAPDGGADEAGQDGRDFGERVRRGCVVGGLELAAGQRPDATRPSPDGAADYDESPIDRAAMRP